MTVLSSRSPSSPLAKAKSFPVLRLILFLTPLLASCAVIRSEPTPTPEIARFPIAQEFESFYDRYGGRGIFGDPITEPIVLEEGEPLLQYFQTMRLEYEDDPDLTDMERIRIFPLGEWALAGLNAQRPWPESPAGVSRYFAETGQTVQGEFLLFYEANHGERVLGPPISDQLDRDGVRVQYFRNGRLDWHPGLSNEQRIQVGHLGQAHFDAVMAFAYRTALSRQFVPASTVPKVDVFTSIQYPVLYEGDRQTLFVTVLTPQGRAVSGLNVIVEMTHGQTTQMMAMELAEGQNKIQVTLNSTEMTPGQPVDLLVSVLTAGGDLLGTGTVAFDTWW